jgi:hypothetical protein
MIIADNARNRENMYFIVQKFWTSNIGINFRGLQTDFDGVLYPVRGIFKKTSK